MFICLAREYFSARYGRLIMACSSFVQCLSTLVLGTDTHLGMFTSQYVSTLVLSTDHSSWLVYFLVHQYCSTRYGRLITACLFAQYVSTVVLGTDNSSRHVYLLSALVFICLVHQYLSTRYRHSPQHVYLLSTLVLQYSIRTTHHGLFICLVRQYRSTRYGQLITACSTFFQCLTMLVPQYLVETPYYGLFFICLVPQYVTSLVLGTDTHHGMFIYLVRYTGKNI